MTDDSVSGDEQTRPLSDYERFAEERKRCIEAKREARLLKRYGGAVECNAAGEHPWITASKIAKSQEESEEPRRSTREPRRKLWFAGIAFVTCLCLAVYGAWRAFGALSGAAPASEEDRKVLRVWHSVEGPERLRLVQLAAAYSDEALDVAVSYHPDIHASLPLLLSREETPDVVILPLPEARVLAALGILDPLDEGANASRPLYLPLVDPVPWSLPIVAVVIKGRDDRLAPQERRDFVRFLRDHLNLEARPTARPVP